VGNACIGHAKQSTEGESCVLEGQSEQEGNRLPPGLSSTFPPCTPLPYASVDRCSMPGANSSPLWETERGLYGRT